MAGYRYPTADELAPTEDELKAARDAAGAQQTDSAWGSGIGTVLGGLAGLAPLLAGPAGVPLLAVTEPAGLTMGGAVGSTIGGMIGSDTANKAENELQKGEIERQKKVTALQLRNQALQQLMNTG